MIRAVIFDLDDTLISEHQYIKSGYKHIAKLIGQTYEQNEDSVYQLMIDLFNISPKNVFNRLLEELKISYTRSNIINLIEEYRNHIPTIHFFEDVLPCLEKLKKHNIKIGIITDGYANAQRQKLNALKASYYFDEIIITDELGRDYWKPHPRAFEMMKEKMNIEFKEMIYVGDNPEKDFYISSIYPINTIRVQREGVYRNKNYLENIKENHSIHSLNELDSDWIYQKHK